MGFQDVEQAVREVLTELKIVPNVESLEKDMDLYDSGMTSHASVKLMLALEDRFDLEFPDEMLQRETFSSITVVSNAVTLVLGRT